MWEWTMALQDLATTHLRVGLRSRLSRSGVLSHRTAGGCVKRGVVSSGLELWNKCVNGELDSGKLFVLSGLMDQCNRKAVPGWDLCISRGCVSLANCFVWPCGDCLGWVMARAVDSGAAQKACDLEGYKSQRETEREREREREREICEFEGLMDHLCMY
jgi:hypothetical protein